jgi:hypothetical protein
MDNVRFKKQNQRKKKICLFRITSYLQFLGVFTFLLSKILFRRKRFLRIFLGTTTWLFLDNTFYIETIGFLAVFFEALLGTPQFLRNFRLKSTEGMSVKMVNLMILSIKLLFFFFAFKGSYVDIRRYI